MKEGEGMKLAIIYPDREGWTVDRFRESAEGRSLSVQTVEITDELLSRAEVDARLAGVDAVLWKFADATLAAFLGSYPILKEKIFINTGVAMMPSGTDKFLQQQLLARSSLSEYAIPTHRVRNREHAESLVADGTLEYPFIIKPAWGTNARGVYIITTAENLDNVTSWQSQIAEPFIPSNEEWRVFVAGGVAAGLMRKHRRDTADPTQTIIGGGARNVAEEDIDIADALSSIAERVAALFHLEYAGIDIVRNSKTGRFYVYEANSAAGWQNGFAEATGEDIPGQVLDWFQDRFAFKQERNVAQAVAEYLIRRSHRLPFTDQVLLIDGLDGMVSEDIIAARRRQTFDMGYERLRWSIEAGLERGEAEEICKVKEAVDVVSRRRSVAPSEAAGSVLYEKLLMAHHAISDCENDAISEDTAERQFMQLPLGLLLDHAVAMRREGKKSKLEPIILSRAEASVSWAGNFLIDDADTAVGISTAHTMRQGYRMSVAYIQLVAAQRRDKTE